jgi:hypothetical protein
MNDDIQIENKINAVNFWNLVWNLVWNLILIKIKIKEKLTRSSDSKHK